MKRVKSVIIFAIICFIIFLLNFIIYTNIDKLIPKHENELRVFTSNFNDNNTEFLYEIYNQIEKLDYHNRFSNEQEINEFKQNKLIYNFFKNYVIKEQFSDDEVTELLLHDYLYKGNLSNTIYGDLRFVCGQINTFYIAYSEDLKKICYFDINQDMYNFNIGMDSDNKKLVDLESQLNQNKEEIIECAKQEFSKMQLDLKFNPDTIYYHNGSYILKDTERNIVVHYSKKYSNIFGFYIGFKL